MDKPGLALVQVNRLSRQPPSPASARRRLGPPRGQFLQRLPDLGGPALSAAPGRTPPGSPRSPRTCTSAAPESSPPSRPHPRAAACPSNQNRRSSTRSSSHSRSAPLLPLLPSLPRHRLLYSGCSSNRIDESDPMSSIRRRTSSRYAVGQCAGISAIGAYPRCVNHAVVSSPAWVARASEISNAR